MDGSRVARLGSYALAVGVLLPIAPAVGPLDGPLLAVAVTLAFALAVFVRAAVTTAPADIVLAAFAVPCLLASTWALYEYYAAVPGVYWGGAVATATGVVLAIVVLADGLLARRASAASSSSA